jgi:hypothetical protein
MREGEIGVKKALKDIVEGIDDDRLMKKYKLSPEGLRHLFKQLLDAGLLQKIADRYSIPEKRQIPAEELVKDIRLGRTDRELMDKYKVSSRKLFKVLRKLAAAGHIGEAQLRERDNLGTDVSAIDRCRRTPRNYLAFAVEVYAEEDPGTKGTVLDISKRGLAVEGIKAGVGEISILRIVPGEVADMDLLRVEARCLWSQKAPQGEDVSGFIIVNLSKDARRVLEKFIRLLSLG